MRTVAGRRRSPAATIVQLRPIRFPFSMFMARNHEDAFSHDRDRLRDFLKKAAGIPLLPDQMYLSAVTRGTAPLWCGFGHDWLQQLWLSRDGHLLHHEGYRRRRDALEVSG